MPHPLFYVTAALMVVVPIVLVLEHLKEKNQREYAHRLNEEEEEEYPGPPPYAPSSSTGHQSHNGSDSVVRSRKSQQEIELEDRETELTRKEREAYEEMKRIELELREKQLQQRNSKLLELQTTIEEQKKLLSKYESSP